MQNLDALMWISLCILTFLRFPRCLTNQLPVSIDVKLHNYIIAFAYCGWFNEFLLLGSCRSRGDPVGERGWWPRFQLQEDGFGWGKLPSWTVWLQFNHALRQRNFCQSQQGRNYSPKGLLSSTADWPAYSTQPWWCQADQQTLRLSMWAFYISLLIQRLLIHPLCAWLMKSRWSYWTISYFRLLWSFSLHTQKFTSWPIFQTVKCVVSI